MPEDKQAGGMPEAGTGGEMPAGTAGAQQQAQGGQPSGPTLEEMQAELERTRKALKEANSSDAQRRKRLEELETAEKKRQDESLNELQKAQKTAGDLQTKIAELERQAKDSEREQQERVIRYEVMLKATGLGVVDPEAAVKLMDWGSLEFAENGAPTNLEKVLKDLVKAKPYLVKQATAQGAPNINAGAANAGNEADAKARAEDLKRRFRIG